MLTKIKKWLRTLKDAFAPIPEFELLVPLKSEPKTIVKTRTIRYCWSMFQDTPIGAWITDDQTGETRYSDYTQAEGVTRPDSDSQTHP